MNPRGHNLGNRARLIALVLGDVAVLFALRPRPAVLLWVAAHPSEAIARLGADRVVMVFAGAGLWSAAVWVALGLFAALGTRLPGLGGRACAAVAAVALPTAVRRVAIGAIGLGVLAGPASAAIAGPPQTASPAVVVSHVAHTGHPRPGPSWPTSTPSRPDHHAPDHHAPDRSPGRDTVRVRPSDSLWLIAAHRLGRHASPDRVAAYWPQVYAANRSVVGPDPGLVVPGQVLHLPQPPSS